MIDVVLTVILNRIIEIAISASAEPMQMTQTMASSDTKRTVTKTPTKYSDSYKGRSDTRCFKMETGEQCILGKWQDNGANHAPNSRIKVNKTLTKNKKTYVINDLVVYVILCG
jgi:hypothetical protein